MSAVEARRDEAPPWYLPADLPAEVQALDTPVESLGAGSITKRGVLDLQLAPVAGATRIVHQSLRGPLYLFRPIYLDPQRPEMAFLYTLQMGEGLVQGDRYRVDVDCAPGSMVHFTTQAATKVYRMEANFAGQWVNLQVGAGALLEYLPDPVIPFRDSRFYQRVVLTIDHTASAIMGEILLPGRVARGEAHAYTLYYSDLEAYSPDGTLLFADRIMLDPATTSPQSEGRLGPYDVLATLYIVTRQVPAQDLAGRLHQCLTSRNTILAGVSTLPNDCGVAVRMLGSTSREMKEVIHAAWNEARLQLIGVPAPDLRKG